MNALGFKNVGRLLAAGLLGVLLGARTMALGQEQGFGDGKRGGPPMQTGPKDAEFATSQAHMKVLRELPFTDTRDFTDASRNFIATRPSATVFNANGDVVWSLEDYGFLLQGTAAPLTVNPSLWRQAVLNMNNGLFKITEGIYQVRGFDLASMMIVESGTGIILIDPMMSIETSAAALDLYRSNRDPDHARPVKAVIHTHSHADHFGGVKGVVSAEDVSSKKVEVIAPSGFLDEAISENAFAGAAMGRRALYQYGSLLPKGPKGQVDSGLGKGKPSNSTLTLIPPTITITQPFQTLQIDGVEMVFQLALDTEAPAEMLIWFPQFKALCAAEDMNHLNHNLYTLRGAPVRSGKAWWKAINAAIDSFGGEAEVMFFAHTWPVWGKDNIVNFMKKQRDLYKYVHDQSLHLANQGYTMVEVAEKLQLPASLAQEWFNRDYYGTVNHNAKAVIQRYLGWFDSNPANLHPLPPEEAAKRYVEYMGGSGAVTARSRNAFRAGEYRWVAQVMNHVVFAEPNNKAARELQADALEQLGYQAESSIWRNHYLTAAQELRYGVAASSDRTAATDQLKAMTLDLYFDYIGILLNGPKADGKTIIINWNVLNADNTLDDYVLTLENSALTYTGPGRQSAGADATLRMTRATMDEINTGTLKWADAIQSGRLIINNPAKLFELLSLLEGFTPMFNIVTP